MEKCHLMPISEDIWSSWVERNGIEKYTNTFLHERGQQEVTIFFSVSHHWMFMCLRLTSGQTSSRNICLKSALSIPIAFALIAAMWIYDYTRELKTLFLAIFTATRSENNWVKNSRRLLSIHGHGWVSAQADKVYRLIHKNTSYQNEKRAESGRLHSDEECTKIMRRQTTELTRMFVNFTHNSFHS